jgi:hypothetical protein
MKNIILLLLFAFVVGCSNGLSVEPKEDTSIVTDCPQCDSLGVEY